MKKQILALPLIIYMASTLQAQALDQSPNKPQDAHNIAEISPVKANQSSPNNINVQNMGTDQISNNDLGVQYSPWLYEGSDLPVDESWTFGTLANGIKFAVKKNIVPAGQMSVRVRVDAGALHERDDELGYAHLIEHLTFRGSAYIPEGEAKRIWQRLGVSFGSDSNAMTTATQTVYQLDLPNVTDESFSESMKILSGMIQKPAITDGAVAAEKEIVQAEMRDNEGPAYSINQKLREHMFAGQLMAKRPTIGTAATLQSANAKGLTAFHSRWYRPENLVIVIAGDGDPQKMVQEISRHFGGWSVDGKGAAQPDFGQPDVKAVDDIVKIEAEPSLPSEISFSYLKPWEKVNDTLAFNEDLLVEAIAIRIINRRMETLAQDGASYIYAELSKDDLYRSVRSANITITPIDGAQVQAIGDIRAIVKDAVENPPEQSDIDREVAEFDNIVRTLVDSYPFESGSDQADSIVRAVDIGETVTAPSVLENAFANLKPKITQDRVFKMTQKIFDNSIMRIFGVVQKNDPELIRKLSLAATAPVEASAIARLQDDPISFADIPKPKGKGEITSRTSFDFLTLEQVDFKNGVKAILFNNKSEAGQIRINVRFGNGLLGFNQDDGQWAWTGPQLLGQMGINGISQRQLNQLLNGRRIELKFENNNDSFSLSGVTRSDDVADQLALMVAKLENPGWIEPPIERTKSGLAAASSTMDSTATNIFSRDMEMAVRNNDKRWMSPFLTDYSKLDLKKIKSIWAPILQSGSIEVQVFGDFDKEEMVKLLQNSFGSMAPRRAVDRKAAAMQPQASSGGEKISYHRGPSDQAAAAISWPSGAGTENPREAQGMEILSSIIRDRLFEKFRAEEAAAYSPDSVNIWPEDLQSGGFLLNFTLLKPELTDRFFEMSLEIAQDLAANPISADELNRAVEPILQQIDRAMSGNVFFMRSLEGVSEDPEKLRNIYVMLNNFKTLTPPELQYLAQKYLTADKAFKFKILPKADDAKDTDGIK
ncbi:hypothetical protein LPB140_09855 [Sphingorhabdus lutea]|uniref:Insulinase family protein n=1 Tax=Sphingorhabdus lutea TaxID=1913578 RepID=A0A1L3JD45_9SPHN|nr:insulinase family protein [Sphingorhabdus lutea]APG63042.1 hypothetical protein LPB140_09855 [Sphingorhabdus lutea]